MIPHDGAEARGWAGRQGLNLWRGYTRLFAVMWLVWIVCVAVWFVSHVWRQRMFWLELARVHGPWVPQGDLDTWQRLANEYTVSNKLHDLLSTKEGWFLLALAFVVVPGMVYWVLLGAGVLVRWVVAGFGRR